MYKNILKKLCFDPQRMHGVKWSLTPYFPKDFHLLILGFKHNKLDITKVSFNSDKELKNKIYLNMRLVI